MIFNRKGIAVIKKHTTYYFGMTSWGIDGWFLLSYHYLPLRHVIERVYERKSNPLACSGYALLEGSHGVLRRGA
ncbi:hypothetical protein QQ020_35965 [Fulvivirgaceae bacterium BMA12]|uniref:Uncharacterized protein n=1 Tax=Agaribacillus aureus TaxID=3051825 RepID=A0ABT8LI88_9BACT|nr:hypothetical protein [Fulvivirgaceae bacterium BMA12]